MLGVALGGVAPAAQAALLLAQKQLCDSKLLLPRRYEKRHGNIPAHVSPCFRVNEGDTVMIGQCRCGSASPCMPWSGRRADAG